MTRDTTSNQQGDRRMRRQFAVVIALFLVACVGGQVAEQLDEPVRPWRAEQGDAHGWWNERGLVIPHESFPGDCRLCHVEGSWSELRTDFTFDHLAETGYALEGAHAAAQCLRCHNDRGPAQEFAARGCAGCHVDVHQGKRGTSCQDCHGQSNWEVDQAIADHARTRFPLVGPHAAAACRDCHVGIEAGIMEPLDTSCVACHTDDLARATNPDHRALGWVADCDDCHQVTSSFSGAGFVHDQFALTGGHSGLDCSECHSGGTFTGTPTACASCHTDDYQATINPPHATLSFPLDCQQCHTTASWNGAAFDHSSWPLTGAHRQSDCNACHGGGVFAGTPTECSDCHGTDFQSASDPNHVAAGFSMDCEACHTTSAWEPSSFPHSSFALTGAHNAASCNACHGGGTFSGTGTDCVDCHLAEFQATTDPDHVSMGFPTDCQQCHGTLSWFGATFDHSTFELVGAHAATNCSSCHGGGVFAGTPTECVGCHQQEYDDTTDPPHAAAGIATTCQDCHGQVEWPGAVFDHGFWQLTGAHNGTSCNECHSLGQFAGTPSDCISCHLTDYNAATNPNHAALGFPQTCLDCHTTQMWTGATFNHTWFPITSGDHAGFSCTECHQVPGDPMQFSCIHCHDHSQSEMAYEHQGVTGYVWQSSACYNCHPDGQERLLGRTPHLRQKRRPVPPAPGEGRPK